MKVEIYYSKSSSRFLKKNKDISEDLIDTSIIEAVKKITGLEENSLDIRKLKGKLKNHYRIRTGKIRIIIKIEFGIIYIVNVNNIDFRSNVYK